jgi:hypothetical protein
LYDKVFQVEPQIKIVAEQQTLSLLAKAVNKLNEDQRAGSHPCYWCGKKGHRARFCDSDRVPMCGHCGKKGHKETDCWEKNGKPKRSFNPRSQPYHRPINNRSTGDSSSDSNEEDVLGLILYSSIIDSTEILLSLENSRVQHDQPITWIIDSGCSQHLTGDESLFNSLSMFDTSSRPILKLANNKYLRAYGKGTIVLTTDSNQYVTLTNVLYVKEAAFNLISVSRLTEQGCNVLFNADRCVILDSSQQQLMQATRQGNIYAMKILPGSHSSHKFNQH